MFMLRKICIGQNLPLLGPNLALFGPKLAQNFVFSLFLQNAALKVPNFCYRHFICSFLLGKPNVYAEKIWIAQNLALLGPNLALYVPNVAQNVVFRLFIQNVAFNVPIFVIETLFAVFYLET